MLATEYSSRHKVSFIKPIPHPPTEQFHVFLILEL